MNDCIKLTMTAIITITWLTSFALYLGHDGAVLMSSFAIIGGLAGYKLKEVILGHKNE